MQRTNKKNQYRDDLLDNIRSVQLPGQVLGSEGEIIEMTFSKLKVFLENEKDLDEQMMIRWYCKLNLYQLWMIVLPQVPLKIDEGVYSEKMSCIVEMVDLKRLSMSVA